MCSSIQVTIEPDLTAVSQTGTDFREGISIAVNVSTSNVLAIASFSSVVMSRNGLLRPYNENIRVCFDRCYWCFAIATRRGLEDI